MGGTLAHAVGGLAQVDADRVELGGHLLGHRPVGHRQHAHDQRQVDLNAADRVGAEVTEVGGGEVGRRRAPGDDHRASDLIPLVERSLGYRLGATGQASHRVGVASVRRAAGLLKAPDPGVVAQEVPVPRRLSRGRDLPDVLGHLVEVVAHPPILLSRSTPVHGRVRRQVPSGLAGVALVGRGVRRDRLLQRSQRVKRGDVLRDQARCFGFGTSAPVPLSASFCAYLGPSTA